MSIITLEKPVPKVAESDWYYKVTELKESCDNHRHNAFQLRNESHMLRNDTDVTTNWGTHHTNFTIFDRYVLCFNALKQQNIYTFFLFLDELKLHDGKN